MSTREQVHLMVDEMTEEQLNGLVSLYNEFAEDIADSDMHEQIMKAIRNAKYLAMIDKGISEIENGNCVQHDLIEVEDE